MNAEQPRHGNVVHGTVRDDGGCPVAGALVEVFDKQLRALRPLGHALTGADGAYQVRYAFAPDACKQAPDLLVRASTPSTPAAHAAPVAMLQAKQSTQTASCPDVPPGGWQLFATSDVLFNAPADATIDLMAGGAVYPGPSEYESLCAAIAPCLDGAAVDTLTKDEVTYLARRTGLDASRLQLVVWARKRGLDNGLPADALYGLAREGAPTAIPALLALPSAVLRSLILRAVDDNLVPLAVRKTLDAILDLFAKAAARSALATPADPTVASAGTVLAAVGVSAADASRLGDLRASHPDTTADFWAAARADPQLGRQVPKIQYALQLAVLAGGFMPLVTAIQKSHAGSGVTAARDLVRLSLADWNTIVASSGLPEGVTSAADYAKSLLTAVEQAFPTPAIAFRIASDQGFGSAEVKSFFARNPDFEMRTMHVDGYLQDNPKTATDGVSDPAALAAELRRVQRLFRLSPHYDDIRFFSSLHLGSSADVVRLGRTAFLAQCGETLGADRAAEIFERARQITACAAVLFARYSPRTHGASPLFVPVPTPSRG